MSFRTLRLGCRLQWVSLRSFRNLRHARDHIPYQVMLLMMMMLSSHNATAATATAAAAAGCCTCSSVLGTWVQLAVGVGVGAGVLRPCPALPCPALSACLPPGPAQSSQAWSFLPVWSPQSAAKSQRRPTARLYLIFPSLHFPFPDWSGPAPACLKFQGLPVDTKPSSRHPPSPHPLLQPATRPAPPACTSPLQHPHHFTQGSRLGSAHCAL